jgi:hypothetical protein
MEFGLPSSANAFFHGLNPKLPFAARERSVAMVESECGAVAVGRTYPLPPLSFGGASLARPWLRFHTPLIEPDVQVSRIRLSDNTRELRKTD